MKKILLSVAVATGLVFASCGEKKEEESKKEGEKPTTEASKPEEVKAPEVVKINGDYAINSEDSKLTWRGDKSAKLDFHHGTLPMSYGNIKVVEDKIVAGEFEFNIAGAFAEDIPEKSSKLVEHFLNDHFFNTESQGNPKFVVTGYENDSIKGDLVIREVSQSIGFPAQVTIEENMVKAVADSVHIPMYGFGMDYYEKGFKPTVIVGINLTANKVLVE